MCTFPRRHDRLAPRVRGASRGGVWEAGGQQGGGGQGGADGQVTVQGVGAARARAGDGA